MYCANLETIITGNDSGIISDLIKQVSQMDFVPGRKDLIKDLAFANFDSCRTELTENRKPEFHKDFLDVHIIVNGCESIGFTPRKMTDNSSLKFCFDQQKDLGFIEEPMSCDYVRLYPTDFAIFLPYELHKPLCAVNDQPQDIQKIIIKIHKSLYKNCLNICA